LKAIKSLSGPFYDFQFLPTGGIDETNIIEYVEAKEVLAVGGSIIFWEKILQEDEPSARQHVESLLTKIKERQPKKK
ncbi:4-hydroxy-2-oxoglutarate aldolase, partial [Enterococcus faecalis]